MKFSIKNNSGKEICLIVRNDEDKSDERSFRLVSRLDNTDEQTVAEARITDDSRLTIDYINPLFDINKQNLENELASFPEQIAIALANGEDFSEESFDVNNPTQSPYDPEKIRVETKSFSLKQIMEMIEDGDLDLSPDFQRNFVWDITRKSRLIESILLRIPIPVFYFSMDEDGMMHVVDGLQRLTSIKQFVSEEYALQDLEYLKKLNGLGFPCHKEKRNPEKYIEDKYVRRINTTQLSVNVIDATSPSPVKFDIFRRINTGGAPLNAQEMRNCLASNSLRETLNTMANSTAFIRTTGGSVSSTRMNAQEMALRFMSFRRLIEVDGNLNNYSGQMDRWLDSEAEYFSRIDKNRLYEYIKHYDTAMNNAYYLFGKHAFRKVNSSTNDTSDRNIINKALFIAWSVALSFIPEETIRSKYTRNEMIRTLGEKIDSDKDFSRFISVGTNGWKNLTYCYEEVMNMLRHQ